MKILGAVLGALILLIQVPLWFGKGGWMRVWHVEQDLSREQMKNAGLEARNARLAAEVADLKQGTDAIEERARYELGMVRKDEVFFQIIEEKDQEKNQEKNRGQAPISPPRRGAGPP
jgi:cell division protein FtsB